MGAGHLYPKCSLFFGKAQMTLWSLHSPPTPLNAHCRLGGQDKANRDLCSCNVAPKLHPLSRFSSLSEFWKKGEFWTPAPQGGLGCPSLSFCSSSATTFFPPPPPTYAAVCCHCQRLPSLLLGGSSFSISRALSSEAERGCFL